MKTKRKILALALAVFMMLALAVPAFADAVPTTGSITISNTTKDATYLVYKVFDLTYAEPVVKDDAGKVTSAVAYTYTTVKGDLICEETDEDHIHSDECYDAFLAALLSADSPFDLTESTTAGVYNVTLKSDKDAAAVSSFLTTNLELLGDAVAGEEKNGTGSALTFTGRDFGYYYITSTVGSTVTIDSTIPDVTVVDKNQGPSWDNGDTNPGKVIIDTENHCGFEEEHTHGDTCYSDEDTEHTTPTCGKTEHTHSEDCKKVIDNSVNYGDTVTFDIGINATNNIADEYITYYYITDTLGDGFVLPENFAPVITVGDTELDEDDYTLTVGENTFEIVIPWATETTKTTGEGDDAETIVTAITPKFNDAATHEIHVRYTADIAATGEDVVISGEGNPNTANFAYDSNKPGEEQEPPYDPENPDDPKPYTDSNKKTTKTYVYAIAIEKVDENKDPLAGATFSVMDADGNAIKASATDVAGEYKFSASGVTTFATDDNGYLVIKGLEEGTYTVTEVDAPAGYNKLTGNVDIEAACTGSSTSTTTTTYYYDKDGNLINVAEEVEEGESRTYTDNDENFDNVPAYMVKIENNKGTELPATGGIGTKLFIAFGMIAMLGAGVFLVTNKRISKESF